MFLEGQTIEMALFVDPFPNSVFETSGCGTYIDELSFLLCPVLLSCCLYDPTTGQIESMLVNWNSHKSAMAPWKNVSWEATPRHSTTENANISQQACGFTSAPVFSCHIMSQPCAVVIRRVRKSWLATLKNSSACRIGNQGNACPGCQIFQLWANRNKRAVFCIKHC